MAQKRGVGLPVGMICLASLALAGVPVQARAAADAAGAAQTAVSRLAGDWQSSASAEIPSSRAHLQAGALDQGAAPGGMMLNRMLLLLAPSAAQQQALAAELAALNDPSSSAYHQWLTPQAFADRYANSASDVAAVVAWLQSQGFQVAPLPAGRGWIEFSGTVAQAEQAFQTQIDMVSTAGGTRAVVTGNLSVPAALRPVIAGLVSLDGALATPAVTAPEPMSLPVSELAAETTPSGAAALTPRTAAQLLDMQPLTATGVNGAGQTIAIAARSNVNTADVDAFRSAFGLPASPLTVTLNGADPGWTDDRAAATLAASWAGAAAPGAQIVLAPVATTSATDGVDLSLAGIVDQKLAGTVAVGYASCEAGLSAAHQAFYAAVYQQAAAEGMAVVSAAGDSGAAACTPAGATAPVSTGYGVNALASTPWDTAVGVASFGTAGPAAGKGTLAAWAPVSAADAAYASGGGSSTVYAGPKWQPVPARLPAGINQTGTPNRLLPDVVLPTALDTGADPGLAFCLSPAASATGCTLVRSGGSAAAASLFAGIAARVAQKNGAQGNLTPGLYALSGAGAASGVYNDVAQGSAQLKCAAGSPNCSAAGTIGYTASTGYDLATGLGVPDAQALVTRWGSAQVNGTGAVSVSLAASPTQANSTYNPSASVTLTATVLSQTGGATPTGTVTFYDSTTQLNLSPPETLNSNGVASVTLEGVFALGGNEMVAKYSGDSNYAALDSTPPVNINTQASTTSLAVTPSSTTVTPGQSISVTVALTVGSPPAGTVNPSGVVTLNLDGGQEAYTASLMTSGGVTTATFPTVVIPANSTLQTHTLQAIYPSNTDYSGSTSPQVSLTVTSSTPTVVLTPSTTSPQPGATMQLTASVSPPYAGDTPPTGTVTFTLDGSTAGTATLSPQAPSSLATVSITAPTTGTHTLQVSYSGDTYYSAQTSSVVTFTVAKTTTTTTVTPATTTPTAGSTLQVTATIAPTTYGATQPSGTVTFSLDGTVVGTQTVTQGAPSTASITLPALTSGTHSVTASYSGDTYYAASSGTSTTITASKTSTTMTVTPTTTTPSAGTSQAVTAAITPSSYGATQPSGTVTFTLDGAAVATGTVVQGSPSTASATITVPSSGQHTLAASYGGDTYYGTSSATAVMLNVSKSTPTLTVAPATTTPAAGSSLQLTASISPPVNGGVSPTGTVNFLVDNVTMGTALVLNGTPSTATLTITTPSVGAHTITAVYSGDGNYNTVTSSAASINVTKGSTTLTVTPATTTPVGGSSMVVTATLTASVTGATIPTGTVNFTLDGTAAGSGTLVGGTTASTTITVPTTGTHTLQATYVGDNNFNGSTALPVLFTVAKTTTSVLVIPSTTTPALGATLPVSITITPSTQGATQPSGTVTVTVDGATAGIAVVVPGAPSTASLTLPALTPGTHAIGATYSGDTYYASGTATAATVTVPKSPTTMTITPATTTPAGGSALPVTATIVATNPGSSLPTGTVTFTLDGAAVGTSAVVPGSPATATATLASITPGTHILQATYSGDTYYAAVTAQSVTLTVAKSPTTITITPSTLTPTAGGSMIVTANIVSANPSTAQPSGTVTITQDGVAVGTATVVAGSPSIATVTLPLVSAGSHLLQGTYSGDTYYTGSTSSTVSILAAKGSTTTTVAATPAALTAGTAETLTATIVPTDAVKGTVYTITGVVSFYDGGTTLLGQAPVSNNTATLTNVSLKDNVSHTITAVYSGDTNWLSSTSTALPLAATTLPDYVVLTSNLSTAQPGAAVVLTATVTPASTPTATGEQNPTGTVIFYNGTTVIGTAMLTPAALGDSSTATLTIQTLPGGQDTITAYYQGDDSYDAATSNILSLTVQAFAITPASTNPATNLNIVQGGAGSVSFLITGEGGFNSLVQVVCTPPAQDNMTCTASPQQVTPPGTVTFVVQTFTGGTIASLQKNEPPLWPRATGGAALAALLFFLLPYGRRARRLLRETPRRWLVLVLLLAGLGGAGIGCTSNQAVTGTGTPLGVATLKVTGSAYVNNTVVSQSVYFTVNVLKPGTTAP